MVPWPRRHDQVSEETRIGRALLLLQADAADTNKPSWVNRRVEQLEFLDTRATSRRISVDFNVPATAPCISVAGKEFRLVPITTLPKGNLAAFDFRDENGCALWLPTSEESGKFLASAITHWATQILAKASPKVKVNLSEIISDLTEIVTEDPAAHSESGPPFGAAAASIDAESSYKSAQKELARVSGELRDPHCPGHRETRLWLKAWKSYSERWAGRPAFRRCAGPCTARRRRASDQMMTAGRSPP